MQKVLLLAVFLIVGATCQPARYGNLRGHKVLTLSLSSNAQLEVVRTLAENGEVDVWSRESEVALGDNDVRIPPDSSAYEILDKLGVESRVMIPDLEALAMEERATFKNTSSNAAKEDWFTEYHRYEGIVARMQFYASEYPQWVTFNDSIGPTVEGNAISALKISTGSGQKNAILSNGCIHAREWISPATVMYIIETFLQALANNEPDALSIIEDVDLLFVPVLNVDGYMYTWDTNRNWRKSRSFNPGSTARGVDLNRNFDNNWGGPGSSPNPSSDTYRGPSAASEPETQALADFFNANQPVAVTIDWHSYSQYILRPWAWTSTPSQCEAKCSSLSNSMAAAIRAVDNKIYSPGIWYTRLYPSSGTLQDYCYAESQVSPTEAVGYTVELRPTGSPGFLLPPSQIIPTGQENYAGFLLAAKAAAF